MNKEVLSLNLNIDRELLIRTVRDSECQTDGAENRKTRLEKSVLVNGLTSSGMMADERKFRLQICSVIRSCRYVAQWLDDDPVSSEQPGFNFSTPTHTRGSAA